MEQPVSAHFNQSMTATARDAQLEAFVLGGYQRLEALDVPVFDTTSAEKPQRPEPQIRAARLLSLPGDLPREIATFEEWQDGTAASNLDPIARLSLLLRYIAQPVRFEPFAESALHKAVPSARMLCPVRYVVFQRSEDTVFAYRYEGAYHALEPLGEVDGDPGILRNGIMIGAIAHPIEIMALYGDFAVFPSVLEAGHAFAQIGQLAGLLGMDPAYEQDRSLLHDVTGPDAELGLYAMRLDLSLGALDRQLPSHQARIAYQPADPAHLPRYPNGMRFLEAFRNDNDRRDDCRSELGERVAANVRTRNPALPGAVQDVPGALATMRARTAGNDRSGIAARLDRPDPALFDSLITRFAAMRASRLRLPGESAVGVQFAVLRSDIAEPGLYDVHGKACPGGYRGAAFVERAAKMLPYRGMRYNFSTLALSLLVTTDPVSAIDRLGGAALRETHLAAGAIAQDFGNAAATLGLFARPMRMMRESTLELALRLDGQMIYQALCGMPRRANLAMELA